MGLLTIIRKIKMKEREMRILILGLDNAGKVCFLFFFLLCFFSLSLLLTDDVLDNRCEAIQW